MRLLVVPIPTLPVKIDVPELVNLCPDGIVKPAFTVINADDVKPDAVIDPDDVKPAAVIHPDEFIVPATFNL